MKLIVGLGNPGLAYKNTRHNLGFMAVDALGKRFKAKLKADNPSKSFKVNLKFKGVDFILCKPSTYMNLSGSTVASLALRNKTSPSDILIICDDINLDLGRIRIRAKGSCGGHNGLESIINSLGSNDFPRIRIGIASPRNKEHLSEYVLSRFEAEENKTVLEAIDLAQEAALSWLEYGIHETMNKYNKTNKEKDNE